MARRMLSILKRIEHLPCWSIACVNGAAYGGGCETMLAFDFRVAADSATFGFTQGKFYLPPGWGGLTRLVERVGRPTALKWLAEAAVVDSRTALAKGLVDEVFPAAQLVEETWNMANRMTMNDRDYIAALKKGAFRFSELRWDAIEAELQPFSRFWADERHRQRVEKFLDKDDSGENQSVK
jgi:enoyl-CoA hydratase/carnithine racemase